MKSATLLWRSLSLSLAILLFKIRIPSDVVCNLYMDTVGFRNRPNYKTLAWHWSQQQSRQSQFMIRVIGLVAVRILKSHEPHSKWQHQSCLIIEWESYYFQMLHATNRLVFLNWLETLRSVLTLLLCMFAFICLLLLLLFPGSLNQIDENGFEFEHKGFCRMMTL